MTKDIETFNEWAIVDVMGHQRYVGHVTEQVIAGQGFVRVDVPENDQQVAWSKLIGTGSIYAITPVSEQIARELSKKNQAVPVYAYELPPRLTDRVVASQVSDDDDDDDYYDEYNG